MAQEALRAEKELRIGLALAEPHETYYWGWPLIESLRGLLALDLLDLDREAEAREVAARICRAYASPPAASMAQVIFDKHLCE